MDHHPGRAVAGTLCGSRQVYEGLPNYVRCVRPGWRCEAGGKDNARASVQAVGRRDWHSRHRVASRLCTASVGPAAASVRHAATAHSGWGSAKNIPHLNALAVGRDATALAVDCSSDGNCVAGGFYADSYPHDQGLAGGPAQRQVGQCVRGSRHGVLECRW
jgi:hypothetical protein